MKYHLTKMLDLPIGTMAVMTRKLGKDSKMQKADNVRIMHQNVLLIKEVNDLRHDLKMARADTHDLEVIMGYNSKNRPPDIVGGKGGYSLLFFNHKCIIAPGHPFHVCLT